MWNKIKYTMAVFGGPLFLIIDTIVNKNIIGHALVMPIFILLGIPIWPFFLEAWRGKPLSIDVSQFVEKISESDARTIDSFVSGGETLNAIRMIRRLLPGMDLYKARLIAIKIHTDSLNLL